MRLDELGEDGWIQRLEEILGRGPDRVGDDAACVAWEGGDVVLTSDAVMMGRHVEEGTPPEQVGAKAVKRLLSDLAAMGAAPHSALVNLVAPASLDVGWLESCYRSMNQVALGAGLVIRGGDTTSGAVFQLHVFGVGSVPSGTGVPRGGGRPGDGIYVTGSLGGSRNGKHLDFEPRIAQGAWLRRQPGLHAMMDITDGLALDLSRLCRASSCACEVFAEWIPVSDAAPTGDAGIQAALQDGEDYELLFTVAPDSEESLFAGWGEAFPDLVVSRIGRLIPGTSPCEVHWSGQRHPLSDFGGYDHFAVDFPERP